MLYAGGIIPSSWYSGQYLSLPTGQTQSPPPPALSPSLPLSHLAEFGESSVCGVLSITLYFIASAKNLNAYYVKVLQILRWIHTAYLT